MFTRDVEQVTRTDLKPYCIEITTREKTVYMVCSPALPVFVSLAKVRIYDLCSP